MAREVGQEGQDGRQGRKAIGEGSRVQPSNMPWSPVFRGLELSGWELPQLSRCDAERGGSGVAVEARPSRTGGAVITAEETWTRLTLEKPGCGGRGKVGWELEGGEPGQGRGLSRWGGRLLVHVQLRTGAQEALAGEQREERKAGKSS